MLANWRTHEEYQSYLVENIIPYFLHDRKMLSNMKLHYQSSTFLIWIQLKLYLFSTTQLQVLLQKINLNSFVPLF